MSDVELFDRWAQTILGGVVEVGKRFTDPEEDWAPVLFTEGADGRMDIYGIEPPRDAADKEAMARAVRQVISRGGPARAALVLSAWARRLDAADPALENKIAHYQRHGVRSDPDREKIVMVEVSDGERFGVWAASILRRPDGPPTLGPWEKRLDGASDIKHLGGRFALVVHRALQAARGAPENAGPVGG